MPQKKLWCSRSLPGPPGQNIGEALQEQSNVLLDKECINVSSQEDNEQSMMNMREYINASSHEENERSMMNMRQKLSELENEVREKSIDLIFVFRVGFDYSH